MRARIALTPAHEPLWPVISRDVLEGNNVAAAEISFAAEQVAVTIEPHAADA